MLMMLKNVMIAEIYLISEYEVYISYNNKTAKF